MGSRLIFTERSVGFILEAFELSTREDGIIIDKYDAPVLDMFDKQPVHVKDLAGIHKDGLIKGDIHSIMQLAELQK